MENINANIQRARMLSLFMAFNGKLKNSDDSIFDDIDEINSFINEDEYFMLTLIGNLHYYSINIRTKKDNIEYDFFANVVKKLNIGNNRNIILDKAEVSLYSSIEDKINFITEKLNDRDRYKHCDMESVLDLYTIYVMETIHSDDEVFKGKLIRRIQDVEKFFELQSKGLYDSRDEGVY